MIQNALTGIVIIAVLTQIFKAVLQAAGMDNTNRWQNPLVWLFMLVIGVGGYVLNAALNGSLTGPIVKDAAGVGFLAISSAIGQYSLVTHNYFNPDNGESASITTGDHTATVRGKNAIAKLQQLTASPPDTNPATVSPIQPLNAIAAGHGGYVSASGIVLPDYHKPEPVIPVETIPTMPENGILDQETAVKSDSTSV